jgi:hypothetical protein
LQQLGERQPRVSCLQAFEFSLELELTLAMQTIEAADEALSISRPQLIRIDQIASSGVVVIAALSEANTGAVGCSFLMFTRGFLGGYCDAR